MSGRSGEADETFVKHSPAPLEAAGLRWLAAGGARVPAILDERPDRLVLQRVPPGRLTRDGEHELGRMLATVHASGAPQFGSLPAPGRFLVGACELDSPEADDWDAYYLQHRLLPLARRAGLEAEVAAVRVESPREPPARLHGDLWWGNVLADEVGRPWLVDPAAHGGHREVDLAMLALFGPLPDAVVSGYEEVNPLAAGWRERLPLWQLFPLLVHAVLFGAGYLRQSRELALKLAR